MIDLLTVWLMAASFTFGMMCCIRIHIAIHEQEPPDKHWLVTPLAMLFAILVAFTAWPYMLFYFYFYTFR